MFVDWETVLTEHARDKWLVWSEQDSLYEGLCHVEPEECFGHLLPTSVIVSACDFSVLEILTHEIDSI